MELKPFFTQSARPTAEWHNLVRFGRKERPIAAMVSNTVYDTVVIGGAINGSGTARDLALRGASVLVLQKQDPTRATNNSSRLGHGGLRYLPHLEFGLVQESRRELAHLLKNAPHLTRPLAMLVPVYKGDEHPYWMIKAGLMLYDWFSRKSPLPRHKGLAPKELETLAPGIRNDGKLVGGFQYYDTQVAYPERLSIENLRDAQARNSEKQPVHVLGNTQITQIDEQPDHVRLTFTDQLTGKSHVARARYVVNTAGAEVDSVIKATRSPSNPALPQMGPTKGTHIMVPNKLNLGHTVYAPAKDGRPFFIIPFPVEGEDKPGPYLLIGTTDDKKWNSRYPESSEVDYLLASVKNVFPQSPFTRSDIFRAYSGFRPLPASNKKAGAVTRKHIIRHIGNSRIFHVIGGKITTYRNLSEQVADKVVRELRREIPGDFGKRLQNRGRCLTLSNPLPGGQGIINITAYKQVHVPKAAKTYDVPEAVVSELINRYGSKYTEVLDLTRPDPQDPAKGPHLKQSLTAAAPLIKAQVLHAIRYENAETLMDVMTESLKMDLLPGGGEDAIGAVMRILEQEKQPFTALDAGRDIGVYMGYLHNNRQWQQLHNQLR